MRRGINNHDDLKEQQVRAALGILYEHGMDCAKKHRVDGFHYRSGINSRRSLLQKLHVLFLLPRDHRLRLRIQAIQEARYAVSKARERDEKEDNVGFAIRGRLSKTVPANAIVPWNQKSTCCAY